MGSSLLCLFQKITGGCQNKLEYSLEVLFLWSFLYDLWTPRSFCPAFLSSCSDAPKHAHIVKGAEQQDSDGTRFVMLSCDSQSYPPIKEYSWYKKDENIDRKVSQSQFFKVSSNDPGVYYCIAKNEMSQKQSDPVNLFDSEWIQGLVSVCCFHMVYMLDHSFKPHVHIFVSTY